MAGYRQSAIAEDTYSSRAHFCDIHKETSTDLPQPASYAARVDDDRQAFEFAYALYPARQVDQEAAPVTKERPD